MSRSVCIVIATLGMSLGVRAFGYAYSSERYAYEPRHSEAKESGVEFYVTDANGGEFSGLAGSVPVFFCKFGNMVASNVAGFEKPLLWKIGNKVVVQTGYDGDSSLRAHGEVQIVVLDADAGEMSVMHPSADDLRALNDANRIEFENHMVICRGERSDCRRIPVVVKHKLDDLSRIQNQRVIEAAAKRGQPAEDVGKRWTDPNTGLEWSYVEVEGGVEIANRRTGGWAVSVTKKDELDFPARIAGHPVISIDGGAIVSRYIRVVRIPETVERFGSCGATFALNNAMLRRVEVDEKNKVFRSADGLLYDSTGTVLLFVPCAVPEVVIPHGVTKIATFAFRDCYPLNRVTIPSTVKELGEDVFSNSMVEEVRFLGAPPNVSDEKGPYFSAMPSLKTVVKKDVPGWKVNDEWPKMWCNRSIVFE